MKLQNTLLTATAICYYILLFLQPADSCATRGHNTAGNYTTTRNNDPKHCKTGELCPSPVNNICIPRGHESDMSKSCRPRDRSRLEQCPEAGRPSYTVYIPTREEGYCHPRCNRNGSCSDKNHKCVRDKASLQKFCIQMTDEDWNKMPECQLGRCGRQVICFTYRNGTMYCSER